MGSSGRWARIGRSAAVALLALAACSKADASDPATASSTPSVTASSPSSSAPPPPEHSVLDGVYEAHLTTEDAIAMDLPGSVRQELGDTYWTMNLSLAYAQMHYAYGPGPGFCCDGFIGDFVVEGTRLVLTDQDGTITLKWHRQGKNVTFTLVDDTLQGQDRAIDEYVFTSSPWMKTGS